MTGSHTEPSVAFRRLPCLPLLQFGRNPVACRRSRSAGTPARSVRDDFQRGLGSVLAAFCGAAAEGARVVRRDLAAAFGADGDTRDLRLAGRVIAVWADDGRVGIAVVLNDAHGRGYV